MVKEIVFEKYTCNLKIYVNSIFTISLYKTKHDSFASIQLDVIELALNRDGASSDRQLAIIDKNKDLYLRAVRQFGTERVVKLGMCGLHLLCLRWSGGIGSGNQSTK